MKILITGGTGFVGTQLTSRLIQDGYGVTILTRSLKGAEGHSQKIIGEWFSLSIPRYPSGFAGHCRSMNFNC